MTQDDQMLITAIVAIYGAVLSTVAVVWSIITHVTNKGKLRVVCYIANIAVPGGPPDKTPRLAYTVTNIGKKPVVVSQIGGRHAGDREFLFAYQRFPMRLDPGDKFAECMKDLRFLGPELRFLGAWDSLGNVYKVKRKVLRRLLRESEELHSEQSREQDVPGSAHAASGHGLQGDRLTNKHVEE